MIVTLRTTTPSRGDRAKRINGLSGRRRQVSRTRMPHEPSPCIPAAECSGTAAVSGGHPRPVTSRTDSMVSSAITFARSALEDMTAETSASDMPW